MKRILPVALAGTMFAAGSASAQEFRFEDFPAVAELRAHLQDAAPVGAPREALRAMLVGEGGAGLHLHPERANVEKYVYTINLCRLYVWEWNISADYSPGGALTEIYVNGEPVHGEIDFVEAYAREEKPDGVMEAIFRAQKPRPEADLGEREIGYVLYDRDGEGDPIVDELVVVGGPGRADPRDLGRMQTYSTQRWRSIVDEVRGPVVDYQDCPD